MEGKSRFGSVIASVGVVAIVAACGGGGLNPPGLPGFDSGSGGSDGGGSSSANTNGDGRPTRTVYYFGAGGDGTWGTGDDVVGLYFDETYDDQGRLSLEDTYAKAGKDRQWFTADDPLGGYMRFDYTGATGRNGALSRQNGFYYHELAQARQVNLSGPGKDKAWHTDDDIVSSYSRKLDFDAKGIPHRGTFYYAAGKDRAWFTDDDTVGSYATMNLDANGCGQETQYNNAGKDRTWFTDDDVVEMSHDWKCERGRVTRAITYDPSGNMLRYWDTVYDASGFQTDETFYNGSGADGTWFTADDVIYQRATREYRETP